MTIEPLREVKDHFSEYADRAEKQHERVVVTRNGRPSVVIIGYDDLEALEETLAVLSDQEAIRDIAQADEDVRTGNIVRGVEAVRALRPRR